MEYRSNVDDGVGAWYIFSYSNLSVTCLYQSRTVDVNYTKPPSTGWMCGIGTMPFTMIIVDDRDDFNAKQLKLLRKFHDPLPTPNKSVSPVPPVSTGNNEIKCPNGNLNSNSKVLPSVDELMDYFGNSKNACSEIVQYIQWLNTIKLNLITKGVNESNASAMNERLNSNGARNLESGDMNMPLLTPRLKPAASKEPYFL